jgi:molybdopterin molybdotransferase
VLSIPEALAVMLPRFGPLDGESLPLTAANGRVLAEDLLARWDLPEFTRSAMDGYAVSHAGLRAGQVLPLAPEIRAGGAWPAPLPHGHAARIFTGAPLPAAADTVVILEHTELASEAVLLRELPALGANVRLQGSDAVAGTRLLARGALLGPGEIGLLAAQGCAEVMVTRKPRVAILATGDELRAIDAPATPGSIINSNSYALAAAVEQAGASAVVLPPQPDRSEAIAAAMSRGLECDVLITVGGVSVGAYDLVADAFARLGIRVLFHKVAIKPGKPLLFGVHESTPVIGLPGNPVSALVVFEVFVRPCLQRMLGRTAVHREVIDVLLAAPYRHAPGRTELVRARLARSGSEIVAHVHPQQGSGSLTSLAAQDALVIVPAEVRELPAGARVRALCFAAPHSAESPF